MDKLGLLNRIYDVDSGLLYEIEELLFKGHITKFEYDLIQNILGRAQNKLHHELIKGYGKIKGVNRFPYFHDEPELEELLKTF